MPLLLCWDLDRVCNSRPTAASPSRRVRLYVHFWILCKNGGVINQLWYQLYCIYIGHYRPCIFYVWITSRYFNLCTITSYRFDQKIVKSRVGWPIEYQCIVLWRIVEQVPVIPWDVLPRTKLYWSEPSYTAQNQAALIRPELYMTETCSTGQNRDVLDRIVMQWSNPNSTGQNRDANVLLRTKLHWSEQRCAGQNRYELAKTKQ